MPDINMQVFEEAQRNQLVTKIDIQTQAALDDYQVQLSDIVNPTQSQDNVVIDRHGEFLPHWNESLDFNTWVKMSIEVAGKQIWMFRGNSSVGNASSIDSTFIFGDDFIGSTLDLNKWSSEPKGVGSSVIISEGECELRVPDNQICSANIQSVDTFTSDIAIRIKRKCPNDNEYIGLSLGAGLICDNQGGISDWWLTTQKSGYFMSMAPANTDCKIYEMPAAGSYIALTSAFDVPNEDIHSYRIFEYTYGADGNLKWSIDRESDIRPLGEGFEKYASNPFSLPGDSTGYGAVHPDVLYFPSGEDGYKYWMYYEKGITSPDCEVYLVRSNDGLTWIDTGITNPILESITTEEHIPDPDVIKVGSTWYMFISRGVSTAMQIYRLTSTDGKSWSDPQLVIDSGGTGTWDENDVLCPTVIYEDGTFYLWYTAKDISASLMQVGLATSTDGLNFTKDVSNPIFRGEIGEWDEEQIWHIQVTKYNGYYWLYYVADSTYAGGNYKMGLAKSTDKKNFTHSLYNPVMTKSGTGWETDFLYRMSWIQDTNGNGVLLDNKMWMYYSARGGSYYKIGLAKSWANIIIDPGDIELLDSVVDTTFLNDNKKILITQGAYSATGRGAPTFLDFALVRKYTTDNPTWAADSEQNIATALKSLGRAG